MQSQTLLAKWTFPTGAATDSLADGGIPVNLNKAIHTEGGTSAIDFSKNGLTTKAAQASNWDNGALTKCWVVELNTTGYETLELSSKQQSGGNNPGPGDYRVQYRIASASMWTDAPNTTLVTANNWTSAVLDSVLLPEACKNQPSLFLRWVMTTNNNSNGGTVAASGINKIDDIYITGKLISTAVNEQGERVAFSISPNPSDGPVRIISPELISKVEFINYSGSVILSMEKVNSYKLFVESSLVKKGVYFIRLTTHSGKKGINQLIVL